MQKTKIVKKLSTYDSNFHRTVLLGAFLLLLSTPLTVSALKTLGNTNLIEQPGLITASNTASESEQSSSNPQTSVETPTPTSVANEPSLIEKVDTPANSGVVEQKPKSQAPSAQTQLTSSPAPTPAAAQPASNSPAPASAVETASSLSFINNVRNEAGKNPLQQNATMNQWALDWAINISGKCKLDHQNLNQFLGRNIGPATISSIAENVGYASNGTQAVLQGLKNSPGHYNNMIGNYSYVGLGVVVAGSGACKGHTYTTQIFAK